MGASESAPGPAGLHLASGVVLPRPEEQASAAMLDGWRNQQLARRLAFSTAEGRELAVRAFAVGFVIDGGLTTTVRLPRGQRP